MRILLSDPSKCYSISIFPILIPFNLIFGGLCLNANVFSGFFQFQEIEAKYGFFPENLRLKMVQESKKMFYFGYDSYMRYAFPLDELNPINCSGRGRDHENPGNININDILGDFSLTLIDSLDTLAILGNASEFQRAVKLVVQNVSFDKDSTVQVFEVNIRILGALLSAHLLLIDSSEPFGPLKPDWYDDELLELARDLASRLLPAFEKSDTGIPYPRVNLQNGLPQPPFSSETCPAGAGSLLLEMGILSKLLREPIYEEYARKAIHALWKYRANSTGLLGNIIDARSGQWVGHISGLGAGLDSFYEYLLKSYILFGNNEDYAMFSTMYETIKQYMRKGRRECNAGQGNHPMFVNVHMQTGSVHTTWIDSLQASFAGIQVLHGDIEDAICTHVLYYLLWKRYGVLPERWDWKSRSPSVHFYPLRPELIESTYLLYRATKNPFYLHVGKEILESLNKYTRTNCGYATVHSVIDMSLEDRMESFFLSETSKYLYLLFDQENYINKNFAKFIFSTEGHIFQSDFDTFGSSVDLRPPLSSFNVSKAECVKINEERRYFLPLKGEYLTRLSRTLGVDT